MKKYIILISIIILNFSCLKKNESTASSFIGAVNKEYIHYKLCYSQIVARFKCYSDIDISNLDYDGISSKCNTLTAFHSSATLTKEDYGEDIYNKIIEPITTSNTLTVLTIDYDLFQEFDSTFRQFSRKITSEDREKYTYDCPESNAGIFVNLWKKIIDGSNIIYQQYSSPDLKSFQWSFIGGKSPAKMNYQEALKACSEYNSDWSLVSSEDLQKAIEKGLGVAVNQALNQNVITPNYFIWTKKNNNNSSTIIKQAMVPWKQTPKDISIDENNLDTQKHYVVCSRKIEE